jgi:hypothetical protein
MFPMLPMLPIAPVAPIAPGFPMLPIAPAVPGSPVGPVGPGGPALFEELQAATKIIARVRRMPGSIRQLRLILPLAQGFLRAAEEPVTARSSAA